MSGNYVPIFIEPFNIGTKSRNFRSENISSGALYQMVKYSLQYGVPTFP